VARRRRPIAVACIALVVLAALLPLGGVSLDWIVVPDTFVLVQWFTPDGTLVEPLRGATPATAYLRSPDSRGPPRLSLV